MSFLLPFLLAAVCATAMCDRVSEFHEHAKECSEKHNIPIADIQKMMLGESVSSNIDSNFKCMALCMTEKEGLTKDGVLLVNSLSEIVANAPNKDIIIKAIADCKDVKGTDACDSAYKILSCLTVNKFG